MYINTPFNSQCLHQTHRRQQLSRLLWEWHQEAHLAKASAAWVHRHKVQALSGWRVVTARRVKLARLLDMVLSRRRRVTLRAVFEVLYTGNATRLARAQGLKLEELQVC